MNKIRTARFVGGFSQAMEDALGGVVTVACPYCRGERMIEPDG